MATTTDEAAKRACYKILGEGDVGQLMNKITAIEAFPERRTPAFSAKPIISNPDIPIKVCTNCKLKGHLAPSVGGGAHTAHILVTSLRYAAQDHHKFNQQNLL